MDSFLGKCINVLFFTNELSNVRCDSVNALKPAVAVGRPVYHLVYCFYYCLLFIIFLGEGVGSI